MTEVDDDAGFEPKILAFCCRWCSYTAADGAGTKRLTYPSNVIITKLPCTGMLDLEWVVKALKTGADGVLVAGCHPKDCHYGSGNYKALKRVALLKALFRDLGIDEGRVRLEWISAAEYSRFAEVAIEFTKQIRALGPIPWEGD